jgi:hypothetical protein
VIAALLDDFVIAEFAAFAKGCARGCRSPSRRTDAYGSRSAAVEGLVLALVAGLWGWRIASRQRAGWFLPKEVLQ